MLTSNPQTPPLLKEFKNHLSTMGVTHNTLKNYVSDSNKFLGWLADKHSLAKSDIVFENISGFIDANEALEYKTYLVSTTPSNKTVKRHLSTFRNFAMFLVDFKGLPKSTLKEILYVANLDLVVAKKLHYSKSSPEDRLLTDFKGSLLSAGASKSTAKNYVSDTRSFIDWLDKQVLTISNVDGEIVRAYTSSIKLNGSLSYAKRKNASLKRFFEWAVTEELVAENPLNKINDVRISIPIKETQTYTIQIENKSLPEVVLPAPALPVVPLYQEENSKNNLLYLASTGIAAFLFFSVVTISNDIPLKLTDLLDPEPKPQVLAISDTSPEAHYIDSTVMLSALETKVKALGKMFITSENGDFNITPEGQGKVNILTSNTEGSSLNISNANIATGSLINATAGNNQDSFYLLNLESGSPIVTRFSVDANGNTYIDGSVNIAQDVKTSGNFEINQSANETASIKKVLASPSGATNNLLSLSLEESGLGQSSQSALVIKRLGGTKDAMALVVDDGNARFDGQVTLGSYTSYPQAASEGTIVYSSSDKTAYLWNGSNWLPMANSPVTPLWRSVSGILYPVSTDHDIAVGDPSAPLLKTDLTDSKVSIKGSLTLDLPGAGSSNALCHGTTGTNQEEIVDCTSTPTADYMEIYPTVNNVDNLYPIKGDIVATSTEYATSHEGYRLVKLTKTSSSYQESTIGIISDASRGTDFNSVGHDISEADNPMPVALSGRVQVNIDPQSSAIHPGDYIASSSKPGLGMKAARAGYVVGKALESWSPDEAKASVLVFVDGTYYAPKLVEGNMYTEGETPNTRAKMTLEDIENTLQAAIEDQKTLSAKINSTEIKKLQGDVVSDGLPTTFDNIAIGTYLLLGDDFVIRSENGITTIDSMSSPLYFMGGKVQIDPDGNLLVSGDLTVGGKIIVGAESAQTLPQVGNVIETNAIAGSSSLPVNTDELTVINSSVKNESLIYVTPTSPTDNQVLYVKEKSEGQFVVGLSAPTKEEVKFNWWIIDVANNVSN